MIWQYTKSPYFTTEPVFVAFTNASIQLESFHYHNQFDATKIRTFNNNNKWANLPDFFFAVSTVAKSHLPQNYEICLFALYIQFCINCKYRQSIKFNNNNNKMIKCRSDCDNVLNLALLANISFSVWMNQMPKMTVEAHLLRLWQWRRCSDTQYNSVEHSNASKTKTQYAWCLGYAVLLPKPYVQTTQIERQHWQRMYCAKIIHFYLMCYGMGEHARCSNRWIRSMSLSMSAYAMRQHSYHRQQNMQKIHILFIR